MNPGEIAAAAREITAPARKCGTRLRLADCSALAGSLTVVDLYDVAAELAKDRAGWEIREAIVLPGHPALGEAVRFWESTTFNRGLEAHTFHDRQSALAWLLRPRGRGVTSSPAAPSPGTGRPPDRGRPTTGPSSQARCKRAVLSS